MERIIQRQSHRLSSQAGVSLIEVIVGVGIAALVVLALGTVMNMALRDSNQFVDRMDSDIEVLQIESALRSVLQTAVDVRGVTAAVAPGSLAQGWIWRNYTSAPGGALTALGHFYRENRRFSATPATGDSQFWSTGIFFRPPSTNGRQSGVLFVDLGLQQGGTGTLRADYGDIHFGNIVRLRTLEASTVDSAAAGVNSLTGITFEITYRTFVGKDFTRPRCFLPNVGNACESAGLTMGTDIVRRFKITLFNADMGESANTSTGVRERPLGRIYMFPMMSPTKSRLVL